MRKALFAIIVVAASFAGGAVVNGPGSRWSKALLQFVSRSEDDEAAPGDLARVEEAGNSPAATVPASPLPPLSVEPAEPAETKDKPAESKGNSPTPAPAKPKPAPVPKAPEPLEPRPLEPIEPLPLEPTEPTRIASGQNADRAEAKPNTPSVQVAALEPPAPLDPPEPLPKLGDPAGKDDDGKAKEGPARAGPYADAPGSAPAAAVPPRDLSAESARDQGRDPAVSRAEATAENSPTPPGDWAAVRRRMSELGVSRFGVDGELGGPVRFHCVIPLAGRRAVGQQFEAEGDDLIEAAWAALRRVALWRATEETP